MQGRENGFPYGESHGTLKSIVGHHGMALEWVK